MYTFLLIALSALCIESATASVDHLPLRIRQHAGHASAGSKSLSRKLQNPSLQIITYTSTSSPLSKTDADEALISSTMVSSSASMSYLASTTKNAVVSSSALPPSSLNIGSTSDTSSEITSSSAVNRVTIDETELENGNMVSSLTHSAASYAAKSASLPEEQAISSMPSVSSSMGESRITSAPLAPTSSFLTHSQNEDIHPSSVLASDSTLIAASYVDVTYHTAMADILHGQELDAGAIEMQLLPPPSSAGPSQSMAQSCPSGQTANQGSCLDLTSDIKNCGEIGWDCYSPTNNINNLLTPDLVSWTCSAGLCQIGCTGSAALDTASQLCIDTTSDASNCGSLGYKCSAHSKSTQSVTDFQCIASKCQETCQGENAGLDANGNCVDYNTDSNNCGGQGIFCEFDEKGEQSNHLDGILYPCYQGVCQTCQSGALGKWSAETLQCEQKTLTTGTTTIDDACTTMPGTNELFQVDVWSKCGIMDWFQAYINQNPSLRTAPNFAQEFASDLGLPFFNCDFTSKCGYKQPVGIHEATADTSKKPQGPITDSSARSDAQNQVSYYYTDQFNGYLILFCLSNFNDMLYSSIAQSNDAFSKVGSTIDTMLQMFQLPVKPADGGQSPGHIISEVLAIGAGVLMMAQPEMMGLAMTIMLGTQVYNLFSDGSSASSGAPTEQMVLSAANYQTLLSMTVTQIQGAWKISSTNVLNDYASALQLISKQDNVNTLINWIGQDRTNDLIDYLLSFAASKCFQDENIFFSSQAFDSDAACKNALSTWPVASGPDAFCDQNNRLFYLNYWSYNIPATTVDTCSGASVYSSSSIHVGLQANQSNSLDFSTTWGFSVQSLASKAYQCQYSASPWNGWPFVSTTKDLPKSNGFTGNSEKDPCLVNTPICDMSDQNLVDNCNAANWAGHGLDCTTLEGLSLYCANQLGVTTGVYNFCGTLWPQGPKMCWDAYNDIQSSATSQSCGASHGGGMFGGFWKRSASHKKRLPGQLHKRGCILPGAGTANCGYLNCGGVLQTYAEKLSNSAYNCDTSTAPPKPPASSAPAT